ARSGAFPCGGERGGRGGAGIFGRDDGAELRAGGIGLLFGAGARFLLREQLGVKLRERRLGLVVLRRDGFYLGGERGVFVARAIEIGAEAGVFLLELGEVAERGGELVLGGAEFRGEPGIGGRAAARGLELGVTGAKGGEFARSFVEALG